MKRAPGSNFAVVIVAFLAGLALGLYLDGEGMSSLGMRDTKAERPIRTPVA